MPITYETEDGEQHTSMSSIVPSEGEKVILNKDLGLVGVFEVVWVEYIVTEHSTSALVRVEEVD